MQRWFLLFSAFCAAAEELTHEELLLARARVVAAANLTKLPNYTCVETIERTTRRAPGRRFELIDMVRVEVALVDGKELFSWPGAKQFADTDITDMVTGGAIGSGAFAQFARSVFLTRDPAFTHAGETKVDGRDALRWDFRVPQFRSGYRLRVQRDSAIVGYHGSFWVSPVTLDLIRLQVFADDIPPRLKIRSADSSTDYAKVRIGERDFLLPQRSELNLADSDGSESRNRTRFTGCRQYTGESKLSFADPADETAGTGAIREVTLPAGLSIAAALETPVLFGRSAVGDPVTAAVKSDVKRDGKVAIPKGALMHGRLTLLREQNLRTNGYVVGIHFFAIEWPGHSAKAQVELDNIPGVFMRMGVGGSGGAVLERQTRQALLHVAVPGSVFFVKGANMELRRGTLMQWSTRVPPENNTQ